MHKTIGLIVYFCLTSLHSANLASPWVYPTLASNSAGQAVATWAAWEQDHVTLYKAEFTCADGWQVYPLAIDSGQVLLFPNVSINASGNENISWTTLTGANRIAEAEIIPFGSITASNGLPPFSVTGQYCLGALPFINKDDVTSLICNTYSSSGWGSFFMQGDNPPLAMVPSSFFSFIAEALFFAHEGGSTTRNVLTMVSPTCASIYLGGPFSAPATYPLQRISPENIHSLNPAVATDPAQDNVAIIWQDSPTGLFGIGIYTIDAFGATSYQSLTSSSLLNVPQISRNSHDQMVWVAQNVEDEDHAQIVFSVGTASAWTEPKPLNTPSLTGASQFPRVALNEAGQMIVAWVQRMNTTPVIYAQLYSPTGGWGDPNRLSSYDYSCTDPMLYLDQTGCATVLWQTTQGSTHTVQAAVLPDFDHEWDPVETLYP